MRKFNEEEMAYLSTCEKEFACAIDSKYLRNAGHARNTRLREIWEAVMTDRERSTLVRMNENCADCLIRFYREIGTAYRQQAESAQKQKAEGKHETPVKKQTKKYTKKS